MRAFFTYNISKMTYGYLRLVDNQQTNVQQEKLITELAIKKQLKVDSYVKDQDADTKNWKDIGLGSLLQKSNTGDTILVSNVNHISSSIEDIKDFLKVVNEKGIILYVASS